MKKYKIKNFEATDGLTLNEMVDEWIISRRHISVVNVNIWYDSTLITHYAKIIYIENVYNVG